jgi:hypothetical protein
LKNEELGMRNEEEGMRTKKAKTCLDCLHCKVSASSKRNCRWCFCDVSKNQLRYQEIYWQTKRKVCKKFDDMAC